MAVFHIEAGFAFEESHAKVLIVAANDEFRAEIGDPVIAGVDNERMRFIVDYLKVRLTTVEPYCPPGACSCDAQGGACIQLDPRTVPQSESFATTDTGNV